MSYLGRLFSAAMGVEERGRMARKAQEARTEYEWTRGAFAESGFALTCLTSASASSIRENEFCSSLMQRGICNMLSYGIAFLSAPAVLGPAIGCNSCLGAYELSLQLVLLFRPLSGESTARGSSAFL